MKIESVAAILPLRCRVQLLHHTGRDELEKIKKRPATDKSSAKRPKKPLNLFIGLNRLFFCVFLLSL